MSKGWTWILSMPDNFLVSKQLATKHDRLRKRIEKKKTKSEVYKRMGNKLKISSFLSKGCSFKCTEQAVNVHKVIHDPSA